MPSFDKQYVREWLERQPWDKSPPPPDLPEEIVSGTSDRYIEAYERITGKSFADYLIGAWRSDRSRSTGDLRSPTPRA